ncbi:MAG: ATP-binding protein [Bacteroidales bacterium]|nr:ATP-binding protein [Bacteroidales bacterium]
MILELRLSNMFSLRDEMTLDLQAAKIQTQKGRALEGNLFTVGDEQMLKSVAVFGANASGKSNVVKAIRACVEMIRESHNYNEDTVFGFVPFKFGDYDQKPSSFYVRFLMDGVEYEYSFSMTRTEILTEQLYFYPNGRRSLVFSRDERKGPEKKDIYEFKLVLKRPMDVAANTSRKTLFISRASQMDRELAKQVFRFFCNEVVLDYRLPQTVSVEQLLHEQKTMLLEVLRKADSDIVDIELAGGRLKTYHRNNPRVAFDFETEESEGTKTLFRMMLSMMDIIRSGRLLLIDEIDTSLHTQLVEFIIGMFNGSERAQLVYTSHNTHLLNTDFQRRDQVYFVNKREDGSSDLYSLYDYKDFRDTLDMEKAYLQGRFDAVPYLGKARI